MHTSGARSYTARIANDLGRMEAISRRPVPRRHPGFFFPAIPAQRKILRVVDLPAEIDRAKVVATLTGQPRGAEEL
jgi:hypothetical protein